MTAPKDKALRDRCEEAARGFGCGGRHDCPKCLYDTDEQIADAMVAVAKAERVRFAEMALAEFSGRARLVAGNHSVAKLDRHIVAAIDAAENGE